MDFSSLHAGPVDAHALYSPNSEAYFSPKTPDLYFTESYTHTPDYFSDCFIDDNLHYCSTMEPLGAVSPWGSPSPSTFPLTNPLADTALTTNNANLTPWPRFNSGDLAYGRCSYDVELTDTYHIANSIHSCSSSTASPAISPRIPKHPRPASSSGHPSTFIHAGIEPTKRKRGRPRLHPAAAKVPASSSIVKKVSRPQCIPHTEVERKYREKLNTELERLRRAVPSLLQADSDSAMNGARMSKSAVLAVAINYIKELEVQRDVALDEVRRLGGTVQFGSR